MTAPEVPYISARVYSIPMRSRFRDLTEREGILLEGPLGWGEFCAFVEYDDLESAAWLEAAIEQCTMPWPAPVRDRVPVNCIIPTVVANRRGPPRPAHPVPPRPGVTPGPSRPGESFHADWGV